MDVSTYVIFFCDKIPKEGRIYFGSWFGKVQSDMTGRVWQSSWQLGLRAAVRRGWPSASAGLRTAFSYEPLAESG